MAFPLVHPSSSPARSVPSLPKLLLWGSVKLQAIPSRPCACLCMFFPDQVGSGNPCFVTLREVFSLWGLSAAAERTRVHLCCLSQ